MKTQILRLDPHDDVISTRDKMNWGQTGRVLLVCAKRRRRVRPTPPARTPKPKSLEALEELRQAAHPPVQGWLAQPAARIGFFTLSVLAVVALAGILPPRAQ